MSNIEDDLIADLSAIDARREKLGEALEKLKTTPQNTKSSLVPDSGVGFGQKIFDNSFDEIDYRTPRNTGDRLGHMRFPEPGYTLYKDKQTDGRDFPKEEDNKFSSFGTLRQPVFTDIYLTPTSSLNTRSTVTSIASSTVTWSSKLNPVHELRSPGMSLNDNDQNTMPKENPYGKTIMKPATYDGSGSWID